MKLLIILFFFPRAFFTKELASQQDPRATRMLRHARNRSDELQSRVAGHAAPTPAVVRIPETRADTFRLVELVAATPHSSTFADSSLPVAPLPVAPLPVAPYPVPPLSVTPLPVTAAPMADFRWPDTAPPGLRHGLS